MVRAAGPAIRSSSRQSPDELEELPPSFERDEEFPPSLEPDDEPADDESPDDEDEDESAEPESLAPLRPPRP
jgi:hypothetical protein